MMINEFYDQRFHIEELATIIMLILLDVLILISPHRSKIMVFFLLNIGFAILVVIIRYIERYLKRDFFTIFRDFSILVFLIIIYMEHNTLIPLINPHDVDPLIIVIDRAIFWGCDPTVLLEKVTHPIFTEILQIVYASFYFLPFTLCFILYLKGYKVQFHITASAILIGFYISYIGYYLAPAVGPRFTLEHLHILPLKGVIIYQFLRDILDTAAGITRDCYPSGHALVSVLTAFMARKYFKPFMATALVWTILMLISAVYLRYHYVLDVIAGVILAVAIYKLVPTISRYIEGTNINNRELTQNHTNPQVGL